MNLKNKLEHKKVKVVVCIYCKKNLFRSSLGLNIWLSAKIREMLQLAFHKNIGTLRMVVLIMLIFLDF